MIFNDILITLMKINEDFIVQKLLEKGFYVTDGIKYGLDYLIYTDKPDKVHSKYGCILYNKDMTYQQLIALQRICTISNKKLIIVKVIDDDIEYIEIERFI